MLTRILATLILGNAFTWSADPATPKPNPAASAVRVTPKPAPRAATKPSTPIAAGKTTPAPASKRTTSASPTPKPAAATNEPSAASYRPVRRPDGRRVIALDIGHTVAHPGAFSATGVGEFQFNKRIVELLAARLRNLNAFEPVIINPTGAEISLYQRSRLAARANAELFLAIHHDSALDKYLLLWEVNGKPQRYCNDLKGYGVFMSMKNPQAERSLIFAKMLGRAMAEQGFSFSPHHSEPVAGENRVILDEKSGVYQYDDLIVLKTALMPAALLECGVIVNRSEEKLLADPSTQERIVDAIIHALQVYMDEPLDTPPPTADQAR